MGKGTGVLLVLAGIGAAGYAILLGDEGESGPADVAIRNVGLKPQLGSLANAPEPQPSTAERAKNPSRQARRRAQAAARAMSKSPIALSATASEDRATHPVAVAREPGALRQYVETPLNASLALPGDNRSLEPWELTRALQRELRRTGCYEGEISGFWTPSSRRAMQLFTERVNARLPVDKPDAILLSLAQSHPERVCSKDCPAGQAFAADGRCVPDALIAHAANPVASAASAVRTARVATSKTRQPSARVAVGESPWSTSVQVNTSTPTSTPAPLEGRMALAGPNSEASMARAERDLVGSAQTQSAPVQQADGTEAAGRPLRHAAYSSRPHRVPEPRRRRAFGPWIFRNM
jgi:hypothetical protein